MSKQDWTPVTIESAKAKIKHGQHVTVIHERCSNKASELRKVETTETAKPKMLTIKSRSDMAAARVAKGLSQKELDMRGSFPSNSCNSWEAGRICPTSVQIQSLHRILGIKLERE